MIRLEPTTQNIPDDIIVLAHRLGEDSLISKANQNACYQENNFLYICIAKIVDDLCVVKIVEIPGPKFIFSKRDSSTAGTLDYSDDWNRSTTTAISYGNVDWQGTAVEGEAVPILCWKGVASRHFEVNTETFVDGYMNIDETAETFDSSGLPIEKTFYTPFTDTIFSNGVVRTVVPNGGMRDYVNGILKKEYRLEGGVAGEYPIYTAAATLSPKVLGCAFYNKSDSIVAIIGTNYRFRENPSGGLSGMFMEACLFDGNTWSRLAYLATGRHKANWFFNQLGTEASCIQGGLIFSCKIHSATQASLSFTPACSNGRESATLIETSIPINEAGERIPAVWTYDDPSNWDVDNGAKLSGAKNKSNIEVNENQSCIEAIDYVNNNLVVAQSTYVLNEETKVDSEFYSIFRWLPEYPYDAPSPFIVTLRANKTYGVTETPPVISGGCPPYVFTALGPLEIDEVGTITKLVCVSGESASGSIRVVDGNGEMGMVSFRTNNPRAQWVKNELLSVDNTSLINGWAIFTNGVIHSDVYTVETETTQTIYTSIMMVTDGSIYTVHSCGDGGSYGCTYSCSVYPIWNDGVYPPGNSPTGFISISPTSATPVLLECQSNSSCVNPCYVNAGNWYLYKVDVYEWTCVTSD